ncbi:AbrB/MazE/SpoVT family DNA-binding domain-containing protein [candidate division WWE3 bacterium]|nr:AbrB/MazE/SpoVT family DNA-binding domain-containing protein [candidate division WWE3 bacterium]
MVYTSTVTTKGQVTVPIEIRKEMGLEKGSKVVFERVNGAYLLKSQVHLLEELEDMFEIPSDLQGEDIDEVIAKAKKKRFSRR